MHNNSKHIHILGICGTFMGGLALIARKLGYTISGSDQNVYPPMSTQLESEGIVLHQGYEHDFEYLNTVDLFVIGNAMSRGNPLVEKILERGFDYCSGPQWLHDYVLKDKWVLAVSGTHGKTSTSSMLAWILEYAQMEPGYLIGGVPENFGVSARITESAFFVVEADEYDTAFFDKRSKFVHYHPRTLIINNLEFDHADIFPDLAAIKTQFHHLIRTVPSNGLIIRPQFSAAIDDVIEMGCWSPIETLGGDQWNCKESQNDEGEYDVLHHETESVKNDSFKNYGHLQWDLFGEHNFSNGLAAIVAARHAGVPVEVSMQALTKYKSVKRRLELLETLSKINIYDDFAHHPTAIKATVNALRDKVGNKRIISVVDLRSNTMKMGIHQETILPALENSDITLIHKPLTARWDFTSPNPQQYTVYAQTSDLLDSLIKLIVDGDQVLIMSNGGFDGLHQNLIKRLKQKLGE